MRPGPRTNLPALLALCLAAAAWAATPLEEARQRAASGDLDGAVRVVEAAVAARPDDADALQVLGELEAKRSRYVASLGAFRRSLALRPGAPEVVRSLRGILKPLVRELRESLRLQPGDPTARHALAFVLAIQGRRDKARAQLEGLTQRNPGFAPGWQDLAWIRIAEGDVAGAVKPANRAFELDPGSPGVRRHLKLVRQARADGGAGPGVEPMYGLLEPPAEVPAASSTPTPAPTIAPPRGEPGTPPARIDFGQVDLGDDALVAGLLARIEAETLGPGGGIPETTAPAEVPGDEPSEPPPEEASSEPLPTPLEVLKRIQDSYDAGVKHLAAREYEAAENALSLVVSLRKSYKDAQSRLKEAQDALQSIHVLEQAQWMLESGDGKKALAALRKVTRKDAATYAPDLDLDAIEGRALVLADEASKAEAKLRKAVVRSPEDPVLRYALFEALEMQGRAGEALEELSVLEQVKPGYASKRDGYGKRLARLYVRKYFLLVVVLALGWFGAGAGYLFFFGRRKIRTDVWGDASLATQEALRGGHFAVAREHIARLEELPLEEDRRARVLAWRATAEVGDGELDTAAATLKTLEDLAGETPASRVIRGRMLLAREEAGPAARPYLQDLLSQEPSNRALLSLLHEACWLEGDRSSSGRDVLKRLLELEPEHPDYLGRSVEWALENREVDEEAARLYQRMRRLDPEHRGATYGAARCLLAAGQGLDALGLAKEGLRAFPQDEGLADVAGEAYLAAELFEEGGQYFERLAERGAPRAGHWLEQLRARASEHAAHEASTREEEKQLGGAYDEGVQLFSKGRYGEALPHLEAAAKASSYKKHAGALMVRAHLELADVDSAWAVFGRLGVEEAPSDEFMLGLCYDMARALEARGQVEGARDLYRRVCRADVDFKDAFERFESLEEELQLSS